MVALLPEYPKNFDNTGWQRQKGAIAKIATAGDGTGIGKKLDALKTAFEKIDWDKFRVASVLASVPRAELGEEHVQQFIESCKSEIGKTGAAHKMASDVETDAKALAQAWAKQKLIPKSSTAAATEVSDKAKKLAFELTPSTLDDYVDQEVKELRKEIEKQSKNYNEALNRVRPQIDAIIKKAPLLKNESEWPDFWKEEVRGLGTTIPYVAMGNAKLKPHGKAFKAIVSNQENPKDASELKGRVEEITKVAKIVKSYIG